MDSVQIAIKELKGNRHNPRRISESQLDRLVNSILVFPKMLDMRPIVVNDKNVVLGGNMRLKALKEISRMDAGEIQQRLFELRDYRMKAAQEKAQIANYWIAWLSSKTVPVVSADSLSEAEQREFIVKDNASFGEWDMEEFKMPLWDDADLSAWGIDFEKEDGRTAASKKDDVYVDDGYDDEDEDEESGSDVGYIPDEDEDSDYADDDDSEDEASFGDAMYKDVLYESDNDLEIPNLLIERQAGRLELPLSGWGSCSRNKTDVTTYHFYVDDYRFEHLFRDPVKLLNSGCKAIVEPNCSLHDQTPIAFGLNQIYKKRYLARYCQELGIDVYVDLNVAEKFRQYNRMGVPKGYNAFATRGLEGWMVSLENDLKEAQEISGLDKPNLIVYGGGKAVQEFCKEHGLLYVTDFINAKKL